MRRARLGPQQRRQPVARLALLEEGVVLEDQPARLQVGLAGAGLDRDQLAVDDLQDEPVDVGQLLALLVDTVEVGVAHRRRSAVPAAVVSIQGCSVGIVRIVEIVEPVLAQEQLHPVAGTVGLPSAS